MKRIYKKRTRIHLHEHEIDIVLEACKKSTFPVRNELLVLLTYNHGLRASEACGLKWKEHIDLINKTITIQRSKKGRSGTHPIESQRELELLQKHYQKRDERCLYVFTSEYKLSPTPYSPLNFNILCNRLGKMAGFEFKFTPHMLRHGKGTFLSENDVNVMVIRDFMGHIKLSSTELYIHLSSKKFNGINKGSMFA